MRTTLTLDEDLAERLRERAHRERRSFKAVVNEAVRVGLSALSEPGARGVAPFTIEARHRGFRPGVDVARLNQLADELEVEDFSDELAGGLRP